jgi:hypothetical protein
VKGRNPRAGSAEKFRDRECMQEHKTAFCKIKERKIEEKGEKQKTKGRRRGRWEDEGWG